jgi:hypothetical protein
MTRRHGDDYRAYHPTPSTGGSSAARWASIHALRSSSATTTRRPRRRSWVPRRACARYVPTRTGGMRHDPAAPVGVAAQVRTCGSCRHGRRAARRPAGCPARWRSRRRDRRHHRRVGGLLRVRLRPRRPHRAIHGARAQPAAGGRRPDHRVRARRGTGHAVGATSGHVYRAAAHRRPADRHPRRENSRGPSLLRSLRDRLRAPPASARRGGR